MAGFSVPLSRWFYQGQVSPNAKIYVYQTLTTSLQTVYADGDLITPTTNPVICDSNGEAVFYVANTTALRLYITTSSGTLIRDIDPVYPVANYTVGVTPGTAVANSALVLGPTRNVDYLDVTTLKGNGVPVLGFPGGRLTLTSATPVTTSDVTAATTIYYTPYNGASVPVYNGGKWQQVASTEDSLALDSNAAHTGYHQSGKNFDLFFTSSGVLGTGPAWTSDTARGTGAGTTELQQLNGIWTNKNALALRTGTGTSTTSISANEATFLGTFRTTADGQTEDSLVKRFVWNAYNAVARPMTRFDSTDSWNYSTATWRQANGSTSNQLDFVIGLSSSAVFAIAAGAVANSTATARSVAIGIGLDSTSAPDANCLLGRTFCTSAISNFPRAQYIGYPGIGRHFLTWLEIGAGTDTQSWYGDGGETIMKNGIIGEVFA